ncbi:MAG: DUF1822 family protein [Dolichospermum sp.]|jgi:hypothetical protein|nr:DUF1822 family protein [Microcystis aeruginosa WS75]NCR43182.1 DUF1822 family protein [Microcystis aeruginosa SX13-01]NCR88984.1 DUF1822 family protein [Microcystis aeruginosa G13-10]NCS19934.1 DUF1822 family protein [Microcystis aeruginosa G11-06]NCS34413.1 DUF1822 family protein [Microcystis aeruginosa G11-01]NCT62838.1 DUF1822 family protein [Microcystis aeruginosa G13-01]
MKTRKIITLKGSESEINQLISLFEQEELLQLPQLKVLDIAKVLPNIITIQESAVRETSTAIESIKSEIVSLLSFWQNCLENQGFKTATLGNSISRKKVIELDQHLIELILTIDEINKKEIRIYLKVRPHNGKGYLPENLIVSVFDEEGEFFPSQKTNGQTNILDLTIGHSFVCKTNDSFKISFTLNEITIVESFPG